MSRNNRAKGRTPEELYQMVKSFSHRYEKLELHKMTLKGCPSYGTSRQLQSNCRLLAESVDKILVRHRSRVMNLAMTVFPTKRTRFVDSLLFLTVIDSKDMGNISEVIRIISVFDSEVNKIDHDLMETILALKKIEGLQPEIVLATV